MLKIAGSKLGYKHTEDTRTKMSVSQRAFDRTGKNNPNFGVIVSEETQAILFAQKKINVKE